MRHFKCRSEVKGSSKFPDQCDKEIHTRIYWLSRFLVLGIILFFSTITNSVLAEEGLIGYWPLDEIYSGITPDESGYGRDGTMAGSYQLVSDAERGTVLKINSTENTWVDCGGGGTYGWANQLTVSVSVWVKINQFESSKQIIACNGLSYMVSRFGTSDHLRFWTNGFGDHDNEIEGIADIQDGKWHHVVFTYDHATGARYLYVDSELDAFGSLVVELDQTGSNFYIGGSASYTGRSWKGLIDDVRLYDIALSKRQIRNLYGGPVALNPTPADETGNLSTTTSLSWQPAETTRQSYGQDIYFGTDWYDVRDGISAVHIGLQDSNSYDPGTLKSGTTYYWRVDQIDNASQSHTGYIWSFRTETPGYYMDLFKDSGISINKCTEMPAANVLALSFERLSVGNTSADQAIQDSLFIGNANDDNGIYLYPDGEPRFRCIYIAGGGSVGHGDSYGVVGREHINQYFDNGGSYSGSCAGSFVCTMGYQFKGVNPSYFHMWPAFGGEQDGIFKIDYDIPPTSPLLNYYDFAGGEGELHIDDVQHWNGSYFDTSNPDIWAEGSENLANFGYDYVYNPGKNPQPMVCQGKVGILAWKKDDQSGRLVPSSSHPERVATGKQRDLMAGILRYAMDGNGQAQIKAALEKGVARIMDNNSDPNYAKIGDKQYHHFTIEIPSTDTNDIKIILAGDGQHDLNLYARFGDFAFEDQPNVIKATNDESSDETIVIHNPQPGTWYIGVKGFETPQRTLVDWGWQYTGNTEVLNGVPYTISYIKNTPIGDISDDGDVNMIDLKMMIDEWLDDNNLLIYKGNLVGKWDFDSLNANDSSGNEHNGTLAGDAHIVTDPQRGKVLELDGNGDYVNLGTGVWADIQSKITIAAWVKVDTFTKFCQTIVAKGNSTYRLGRKDNENAAEMYINTTGQSGSYIGSEGVKSINNGQWHHVVSTYDSSVTGQSNLILYVDGQIDSATKETSGNMMTNTQPLRIGSNSENDRDWDGWIDDVRLYDYALGLADIQRLYAGLELLDEYECTERPLCDLNNDCRVNLVDFAMLANDWLK